MIPGEKKIMDINAFVDLVKILEQAIASENFEEYYIKSLEKMLIEKVHPEQIKLKKEFLEECNKIAKQIEVKTTNFEEFQETIEIKRNEYKNKFRSFLAKNFTVSKNNFLQKLLNDFFESLENEAFSLIFIERKKRIEKNEGNKRKLDESHAEISQIEK